MARYRNSSWRRFDPGAPRAGEPAAALSKGRCRILGLDPGSLRTGWGIIDCDGPVQRYVAAGTVKTSSDALAPRLRLIYDTLAGLVAQHQPDEIAIERVFLARNPDSALKLGQARGVAMCAATQGAAPVFEYAPRAVKIALVGTGAAEKLQVAHMVLTILTIDERLGLDASDALAVALCHAQTRRLNLLAAGVRQ